MAPELGQGRGASAPLIVTFTDEALDDLTAIRAYLQALSPRAAERLGRQLVAVADTLGDLPYRGRKGLVEGTRENLSVRPYVIVYRITPDTVDVLRIYHEAQNRTPP